MRALLYTPGSPYARAVRVLLDELGLDYERREQTGWESAAVRAPSTPTLQVPMFWDGEVALWDSELIADYLLSTYRARPHASPPLTTTIWRPEHEWQDKLVLAAIRTFGASVTTISQLTWAGVTPANNVHARRNADRLPVLLDWLEHQLGPAEDGFLPGVLSLQDIFLACFIRFLQNRPLGLDPELARRPRIERLLLRIDQRPSFVANPIHWWEPDVSGPHAKKPST